MGFQAEYWMKGWLSAAEDAMVGWEAVEVDAPPTLRSAI